MTGDTSFCVRLRHWRFYYVMWQISVEAACLAEKMVMD